MLGINSRKYILLQRFALFVMAEKLLFVIFVMIKKLF